MTFPPCETGGVFGWVRHGQDVPRCKWSSRLTGMRIVIAYQPSRLCRSINWRLERAQNVLGKLGQFGTGVFVSSAPPPCRSVDALVFWLPAACAFYDIEAKFVAFRTVWIEVATIPLFEIGMFGVFWAAHGLQELLVFGASADVLGRASAGDVREARVECT